MRRLLIHVAHGNKLWQLRLIPLEKNIPPAKTLSHNIILIQCSNNGKIIWEKVDGQREINSIPSNKMAKMPLTIQRLKSAKGTKRNYLSL